MLLRALALFRLPAIAVVLGLLCAAPAHAFLLVGGKPPAVPVVTATVYTPGGNTSTNAVSSYTISTALTMVTGHTLVVYDVGYGNSGASAPKPAMTAPTVSAGALGTCHTLTGTQILGNSNLYNGTEAWACPITTGATASVTLNWSAACYYCTGVLYDVNHLYATPDVGIGNTANGNSTTPSVSTNGGGVAGKQYLYILSVPSDSTTAPTGPGGSWVQDVNSSGIGWYVYHQVAPSGSVITPSLSTSSAGWNASIVALTPSPAGPTITGVQVAGTNSPSYASGSTSVGAITVVESLATFSGTLAICEGAGCTPSGTSTTHFSLSAGSGYPSNLSIASAAQTCSSNVSYDISIAPTQSGVVNSGTAYPLTVTCNALPTITSVSLNNTTFTQSGSGTVGTLLATLSSGSQTGTFALTTTGTDHSGTTCNTTVGSIFSVSGTSLNYNSGATASSYSNVCVTYTQSGAAGSPYTQAFNLSSGLPAATLVNSATPTQCNVSGAGSTTCQSNALQVANGNTVIVYDWTCANGSCNAVPSAATSAVGSANLGTCTAVGPASIANSTANAGQNVWYCPVTGTGSTQVTVTWPSSSYQFNTVVIQQVYGTVVPDGTISAAASGNSTTAQATASGAATQQDFVFSAASSTTSSVAYAPGGSPVSVVIQQAPNAVTQYYQSTALTAPSAQDTLGTNITITANNVSAQCSGSGVSSCAAPALTVTSGELVAVESWVCGNSCGSAPPTVASVTRTGLSCSPFTLAGTKTSGNFAEDAYLCTVTTPGTVTPTVNYSASGYYGVVFEQAISAAVGDDGIGNAVSASATSGTPFTFSTNGSTTKTAGTGDLCISMIGASGVQALTLAQTVLNYVPTSPANTGAQYQNAGGSSTSVTAGGTYAGSLSYVAEIVCLK